MPKLWCECLYCWKKKGAQTEHSCLRAGCCAWPGHCWQLLSWTQQVIARKMNHGGKTFCDCVRFTRGVEDAGKKYSSPTNQATMGNIKWVTVSWAGLFRQCVHVFVCKTGLFWLEFWKKARPFSVCLLRYVTFAFKCPLNLPLINKLYHPLAFSHTHTQPCEQQF